MPNFKNVIEYTKVGSLVGISYWTSGYNTLHKLFWVGVVAVCSSYSFYMCKYNWDAWNAKPVLETFSTVDVNKLQFPAITVCPAGSTGWISYQNILNRLKIQDTAQSIVNTMKMARFSVMIDPTDIHKDRGVFQKWMDDLPPYLNQNEKKETFGNVVEEWIYKIDKHYSDSCRTKGMYCLFHTAVSQTLTEITKEKAFEKWVQKMTKNNTWNPETKQYETYFPTIIDFFKLITRSHFVNLDFARKKNMERLHDFITYLKSFNFDIKGWERTEDGDSRDAPDLLWENYRPETTPPPPSQGEAGVMKVYPKLASDPMCQPCLFPIIYQKIVIYSCIPVFSEVLRRETGQGTCAVDRLDENGATTPDTMFAPCNPDCRGEPEASDYSQCYTVGGPDPFKKCIFPFREENKTHLACRQLDTYRYFYDKIIPPPKHCATKLNEDGSIHEYGFCSSICADATIEPIITTQEKDGTLTCCKKLSIVITNERKFFRQVVTSTNQELVSGEWNYKPTSSGGSGNYTTYIHSRANWCLHNKKIKSKYVWIINDCDRMETNERMLYYESSKFICATDIPLDKWQAGQDTVFGIFIFCADLVRDDRRCGPNFPIMKNGEMFPGECPPIGDFCCSNLGWCGKTEKHCHCVGCTDFRLVSEQLGKEAVIVDYRKSWYDASTDCMNTYRGTLTAVRMIYEIDDFSSGSDVMMWVGGSRFLRDTWTWMDGDEVSYSQITFIDEEEAVRKGYYCLALNLEEKAFYPRNCSDKFPYSCRSKKDIPECDQTAVFSGNLEQDAYSKLLTDCVGFIGIAKQALYLSNMNERGICEVVSKESLDHVLELMKDTRSKTSMIYLLKWKREMQRYTRSLKKFIQLLETGVPPSCGAEFLVPMADYLKAMENADDLEKQWTNKLYTDNIWLPPAVCVFDMEKLCYDPVDYDKFECTCQCEKLLKLMIYKIYKMMMDSQMPVINEISYLGDVLAWFKNLEYDNIKEDTDTWKNSSQELVELGRSVLSAIVERNQSLSLEDFIIQMAAAPEIANLLSVPNFASWPDSVTQEVKNFFSTFSSFLYVDGMKFADVCSRPDSSLKEYCKLVQVDYPLKATFQILKWAVHPLPMYKKNFDFFQNGSTQAEEVENFYTMVPFCRFGEEAVQYFYEEDISLNDMMLNKTKDLLKKLKGLPDGVHRLPKCTDFHPRPTDMQICHTFNGYPLSNILQPSPWLEAFREVFDDFTGSFKPKFFVTRGIERGFVVALDSMQNSKVSKVKKDPLKNHNKFWLKFHDPKDIGRFGDREPNTWLEIDLSNQRFIKSIQIKVTGFITVNTKEYEDIEFEKRMCKFRFEKHDLELFTSYSEENCQIECHWKKAYEICGCKPWYVPALSHEKRCHFLGNICFNNIIKTLDLPENKITLNCVCPPDCVGVKYTVETNKEDNQLETIVPFCQVNKLSNKLIKVFGNVNCSDVMVANTSFTTATVNPVQIKGQIEYRPENSSSKWFNLAEYILDKENLLHPWEQFLQSDHMIQIEYDSELMHEWQSNLMILAIFMDTSVRTISYRTLDVVMKWDDKISWIGGTIGGFNGFCLISGVELIYWLLMTVFGYEDVAKKPKKKVKRIKLIKKICSCVEKVDKLEERMERLKIILAHREQEEENMSRMTTGRFRRQTSRPGVI